MVVEVEEAPERGMLYRLGLYELLLGQEIAPFLDPAREPIVGTVLLNLTGRQPPQALRWQLPGGIGLTLLEPMRVNFAEEDGVALLEGIESGKFGVGLLPWAPLMRGSADASFIERWKQLGATDPEAANRAFYRDAALVFAELIKEQVIWLQALEGWEMSESQYIKKFEMRGEERGELRARRSDLLKTVQLRLQDPVPEPIRLAVEGTNDPGALERWFEAALKAGSLAELRAAMKLDG
jgi:hypothetical protein